MTALVTSPTDAFNLALDGIYGGVQLVYNWQMVNWVYDLETDIQASSQRDNKTAIGLGDVPFRRQAAAGSAPFAAASAIRSVQRCSMRPAATPWRRRRRPRPAKAASMQLNASTTLSGWTAGAGIETPFTPARPVRPELDLSKTEYLYVDLGSTSNLINTTTITTSVTEHIFRTGLNYHFNSPVVAKY